MMSSVAVGQSSSNWQTAINPAEIPDHAGDAKPKKFAAFHAKSLNSFTFLSSPVTKTDCWQRRQKSSAVSSSPFPDQLAWLDFQSPSRGKIGTIQFTVARYST